MKKQKNVLLALGWYDHRLLRGISTFAATHDWHLAAASMTQEFAIPWGWNGDGILTWLAGEDELADFVVSVQRPTVDFSLRRSHLPFARVVLDHSALARLAVEHFLQRGFYNFLFCSPSDNWTFEERGAGFVAALGEHGRHCEWIKWHEANVPRGDHQDWSNRHRWLTNALKTAQKPLGVFTANGTVALEVLEVCLYAGIEVPKEVAIVGVEDDLLLPQNMLCSITAVDPNLEEQGYQGAALLDRLMAGKPVPKEPVRIKPARVITRQSTEVTAVNHPGVAKALLFLAENFGKNIDIDGIAKIAGMSRRGLHQAFLEHLGYTPGEQLRAMRVEHAKSLLAETEDKIKSIAALSGYPSVNGFFVAFKQACKITPAEFRKEVRRGR